MWKQCCATLALVCCLAVPAQAHFGMVIPSSATVTDKKAADLGLEISFSHPMDMQGMDMAAPRAFTVTANGKTENLTARLAPGSVMGHKAWKAAYRLNRPGVYQFALEPAPYFEPAEDCFIIHYTKTVVAAFGDEEGWDQPLGLKTEIVPLTRPFGNYAGNVFQGQVLLNGKPVPGALVEVECYNRDKAHAAPDAYFVTQTVRADANGVFAYGVPWAGWWGFAALNTAEEKLPHEGALGGICGAARPLAAGRHGKQCRAGRWCVCPAGGNGHAVCVPLGIPSAGGLLCAAVGAGLRAANPGPPGQYLCLAGRGNCCGGVRLQPFFSREERADYGC